jgi:signal transduction histidine kinase
MTRRVVLSYLAVALFVLVILEIPLALRFAEDADYRLSVALERDAVVVADLVSDALREGAVRVTPDLGDYTTTTDARVVIVDADGDTVHDSDDPGATELGRDFSTRPEIADALSGVRTTGTRFSETLAQELRYVAVPVASGGVVHGAVRITYPTASLRAQVLRTWLQLGATGLAVLLAVVPVGIAVARWVTRPTRALTERIDRLAEGDLAVRADASSGPPEVRDLAAGFNAMADRLGTVLADQRAFAADASHQLRSPLTALRLEIEQLPDMEVEERGEAVERAVREIERLTGIVTALLTLARHDGGEALELLEVDAGEIVRERADAWRPLAARTGVLIATGPASAAAAPARCGDGYLEQVLDVLLSNAIAASPDGGTVTVDLTEMHAEDGDTLRITVEDEGPGLAPGDHERAFDRFWRGPGRPSGSGTGLGLPIARRLARLAGGDVTLEGRTPAGTRATVTLRTVPAVRTARAPA